MKLAEALLLRADQQKKLVSLRERIGKNAVCQQGDQPHEDPNDLIKEAFQVLGEFEDLVSRINSANAVNKIHDGRTITQAIAARETLGRQHSILQHAITSSQQTLNRYGMSEIKWVSQVKVASLQKQLEDVAQKIRGLNVAIQETNWKVEI